MPDLFADIPEGATENDLFADIPETPEATTALGAAGRGFGRTVLPGIGAAAGAVLASAAAAPLTGGSSLLAIPPILIGALAGGAITDVAQRRLLEAQAPETAARLAELEQLDAAQHPLAAAGGRILGNAPTFAFAPGTTIKGLVSLPSIARGTATVGQKQAAAAAATQLGLGGAMGVVSPLVQGESPTLGGVTEAAVGAALFGQPRAKALIPRSIRALQETPPLRDIPFPEESAYDMRNIPSGEQTVVGTSGFDVPTMEQAQAKPFYEHLVDPLDETVAAKELAKETSLKTAKELAWLDRAKRQTPEEPLLIAAEAVVRPDKAVELLQTWERGNVPEGRGAGAAFEGTYPPTAEQLGTFQSRGPGGPQSSTGYIAPGRPVQSARPPPIGTTPTQRPVPGVVPPESLQGEFPPARPVRLAGEGPPPETPPAGPPPPSPTEPPPTRPPTTTVSRAKDFQESGEYKVKVGDQTYSIAYDKESRTWFSPDHPDGRASKTGAGKGMFRTIGFTKQEAIKWITDQVAAKPPEAPATATPPPGLFTKMVTQLQKFQDLEAKLRSIPADAEGRGTLEKQAAKARADYEALKKEFDSTTGLIRGSAAEKWADKVLGEDPRKGGRTLLGILGIDPVKDPQRVAALIVKGAALIEQGARDFGTWAKQMLQHYGDAIRPHLNELWNRSQVVYKLQSESGAGGEPTEGVLPPRELASSPVPPQEGAPNAIQEQQPAQVLRDVSEQRGAIEQGVPTEVGPGRVPQGDVPTAQATGRETGQATTGDLPLGIVPRPDEATKRIGGAAINFGRWFSEWMPDRLRRIGGLTGGAAKRFADSANQIISKAGEYYGRLTPSLDAAKAMAGRLSPASRWMNELSPVTARTAVANAVGAVENTMPVPEFAQELVDLARASNLEIGQLLEPVTEGFRATGKWQRNLTGFGYDVIRRGGGDVWDAWTEGVARANDLSVDEVRGFFREWKAALDETGFSDMARIEKINQDFSRRMPKAVTHVKVTGPLGFSHWEPVIHANLFNYLEAAAKRASSVRAFREQFPSGSFGPVFKAVMADIPGNFKPDVEGLVRALQGHPTDSYAWAAELGLSPDQPAGAFFRVVNQTVGDFSARLVLTAQLLTQLPETVWGSTPVLLGGQNYVKGLLQHRQLYSQMEQNGQVSRVLYDNSTDPNSPIKSRFRQLGNIISKVFFEQTLNELQEGAAAATATIVADKMRAGWEQNSSAWEKRMIPQTLRMMGFTKEQVGLMLANQSPELISQFERKAAAFLTSGNKALAQGSRIGANRLFNSLFRFQSYPMMKMNQFRRAGRAAVDAWQEGNTPAEKWAGIRLFGRFMFGTTLQGAIYTGLTSLLMNQLFGFKVALEEAKDEPVNFLIESFIASMGGPMYMVWRGARTHGVLGVGEQASRTFFPYQVVSTLWDATHGEGAYRDLDNWDRLGKIAEQRMPGARLITSGLSMFGLGQENKKLQTSLRAFYRWRVSEMGFKRDESWLKQDPNKLFRTYMKQATVALQKGDREAYSQALMKASGAPNAEPGSIAKSFRARKVLEDPSGKKLSIADMAKLRKHIGAEAVQRLIYYDAMLDAAADGVILPPQK